MISIEGADFFQSPCLNKNNNNTISMSTMQAKRTLPFYLRTPTSDFLRCLILPRKMTKCTSRTTFSHSQVLFLLFLNRTPDIVYYKSHTSRWLAVKYKGRRLPCGAPTASGSLLVSHSEFNNFMMSETGCK